MTTTRSPGGTEPREPDTEVPDPSPSRARRGRTRHAWRAALRGAVREFQDDQLGDTAAALTYYAVLSIFPGLVLLGSVVGMVGHDTTTRALQDVHDLMPAAAFSILRTAVTDLQQNQSAAGFAAVLSVVGAIWSASGYVGAFIRASNRVYDVPEGRPVWITLPLRMVITVAVLLLMAASSLVLVLSGGIARQVGDAMGVGPTVVSIWGIMKWLLLLVLLILVVALLYWAAPNARQPGIRWVTPGGVLGVLLWMVASVVFGLYVAGFGRYTRTYGVLAGPIVLLIWIWVSNLAILLGAEFDAELERLAAESAGLPSGHEPYLALRDTRTLPSSDDKEQKTNH